MAGRNKGPKWKVKRNQLLKAKNRVVAARKALDAAIRALANVVATDPGDPQGGKSPKPGRGGN